VRFKKDPQQVALFDSFTRIFSPLAYKRVRAGWQEMFRQLILHLLPVDVVEKAFDPSLGRPTKELYSMAGLILIMEL